MRAIILEGGQLTIERVGIKKRATCIHKNGTQCGDHCVAFGEPKNNKLSICIGVLSFDNIQDLRYSSETEQQLNLFTKKKRGK